MKLDGIKKTIKKANEDVQKEVDKGAADLKKVREDGEKAIDDGKKKADKAIDNSKLPPKVKDVAKDAVSAGHKAAVKAVDKAKHAAKDAVEKGEKIAKEAVDKAEEEANKAVDKAAGFVKDVVKNAKGELNKVIEDSNLPGPLKDLAKKGLDELEKLANKGIDDLKGMAKDLVKDLAANADDMIGHLKDKALEVLGFEPAKPVKDVPVKPPTPKPPAVTDTSRKFDHRGGFNFRIELGGVAAGAFTAVDGLTAEVDLVEYAGGMDMYMRQIPGRPKIAPITLKKGYINTAALWDWMKGTMEGTLKFENVSIVLLADDGDTEVVRYDLQETWPSRWAGFQLDAQSSGAMLEELELQTRSISRVAA
ncbi:MAG: phage tail protein [Myxococcales bacterium]|nr:phage tail protein [Myxococcales bacterium]